MIFCFFTRVKTLLVGLFVVGAKGSRNSHSSLVLAHKRISTSGCNNHLAEILYFASCVAISNDKQHTRTIWVAAVKWFMEHQCKVWFGCPTQIWSSACYPGYVFIPISDIKSRVVYSHHTVNFGKIIGEEKVYNITPLEHI